MSSPKKNEAGFYAGPVVDFAHARRQCVAWRTSMLKLRVFKCVYTWSKEKPPDGKHTNSPLRSHGEHEAWMKVIFGYVMFDMLVRSILLYKIIPINLIVSIHASYDDIFQQLKWDSPYNNQPWPRITCRVCILLLIATVRCCWVILEQPISSVMPWFPYLVYCQKVLKQFIGWERCTLFCPQSLMLIDMSWFKNYSLLYIYIYAANWVQFIEPEP